MYTVYAICSKVKPWIYVGMTSKLEERISRHNSGREKMTRPFRPFDVIHTKEFNSRAEAREYEKYLKSGFGKEFLKSL